MDMNKEEILPPLKNIVNHLFTNKSNFVFSALPIHVNDHFNKYSNFDYQLHSVVNGNQVENINLPFIIENHQISIQVSTISSSTNSSSLFRKPEAIKELKVCAKCGVNKSYTWRRSKEIKDSINPSSKKGARLCNRCGLTEMKKRNRLNQIKKSTKSNK